MEGAACRNATSSFRGNCELLGCGGTLELETEAMGEAATCICFTLPLICSTNAAHALLVQTHAHGLQLQQNSLQVERMRGHGVVRNAVGWAGMVRVNSSAGGPAGTTPVFVPRATACPLCMLCTTTGYTVKGMGLATWSLGVQSLQLHEQHFSHVHRCGARRSRTVVGLTKLAREGFAVLQHWSRSGCGRGTAAWGNHHRGQLPDSQKDQVYLPQLEIEGEYA